MAGPYPSPELFAGLPLDEPLVDEETWQKTGEALVSAPADDDQQSNPKAARSARRISASADFAVAGRR